MNWEKCQFAQRNFEYLGVKLTPKGMEPTETLLRRFSEVSMPKTQQGWCQLHGWIAHSARFIWKGHELLALLKHLKGNPTQNGWKSFLEQLKNSFL